MVTLLYLNTADKALIMYLYVCFAIWVLHSVYKSDKAKSKAKSNPNSKTYIKKIITNAGTQYVKKKSITSTGTIVDYRFTGSYSGSNSASYAGFEHYELSSSVDTTGSFLTPMITTIGLYNDACELLAVAKLPQPIKSEPDIPVNFIVRFDT